MSRTWHKDRVEKARGSKRFDSSCANHGSCPWCKNNRTFFDTKHREAAENDLHEFQHDECSVCDEGEQND